MIAINLTINGTKVAAADVPVLPSHNVQTILLVCAFDAEWDGYGKTAVFWGAGDGEPIAVAMVGDQCAIPHEALDSEGALRLGVFGVSGDNRLVAERIKVNVVAGAWDENAGGSAPITPTQYEQVMAAVAAADAKTDALAVETPVIHWDGDTLVIEKGVVL